MNNKLICILGKSGSGKDTVFKKILEANKFNIKPVIKYTSRPARTGEIDGVSYHFKNNKYLDDFIAKSAHYNKPLLIEQYDVIVKGEMVLWKYVTALDEINLSKDNYMMIATPAQYKAIKQTELAKDTIGFYLKLSDKTRLQRLLKRENSLTNPNYPEMCRRFLADDKDFSNMGTDEFTKDTVDIININSDNTALTINNYVDMLLRSEKYEKSTK